MIGRISHRINAALERWFPERRLFLKSDTDTRFIRLRPAHQAAGLFGSGLVLAWAIIATAVLLMDHLGAGSAREQAQRAGQIFEARLAALSADRDARAAEAQHAQDRFNLALAQVSDMQSRLLASEDRRRELETGIEVIQKTLRQAIRERDEARAQAEEARLALSAERGAEATDRGRVQDMAATLQIVTAALAQTAEQRDGTLVQAEEARAQAEDFALDLRLVQERNDAIFRKLEEAVAVSMEPLDRMFRTAGLNPDDVLSTIKRGYSGMGGPLTLSTSGAGEPRPEETRANAILGTLDRMNLYRIAAERAPFATPVTASYRLTSPFGWRRDPKGAGSRMHEGVDFAASHGTPILAAGDGTVIQAGWSSGYGRMVTIRHDFGLETRYAHLSQIRVKVGDKVSRGDRIGDMGSTGRSTGTHLHYEVRSNGSPVNPMTFIRAAQNVF
ncbi:MAG: peptidoglycan DD-metalloendopeptidase family protein [Rhodobacterales bacterium]|nr:peptidoglycan DD-metalloendopeptidase family protein [Rhodobacterales bacterium]